MHVHRTSLGTEFYCPSRHSTSPPWQSEDLVRSSPHRCRNRGDRFMKHLRQLLVAATAFAALPALGQTPSVWIDDLAWPEVRDAIAAGKHAAIVYTGSSEQNGPHMVIGKHNIVAHYAAQRIAEQL